MNILLDGGVKLIRNCQLWQNLRQCAKCGSSGCEMWGVGVTGFAITLLSLRDIFPIREILTDPYMTFLFFRKNEKQFNTK